MLKLKISIITLIISLFLPSIAYSAEAVMLELGKNQKAPFSGTLLNPPALAEIAATSEQQKNQCILKEEFATQREKTRCDLLVSSVSARLDASRAAFETIVEIKNDEIDRLISIAAEQPNKYNHWWFAGGMVVGIATSIAIFYASVQVSQ